MLVSPDDIQHLLALYPELSGVLTVRIAMAPMTMTSAMPASFFLFLARRLARALLLGFVIAGFRS